MGEGRRETNESGWARKAERMSEVRVVETVVDSEDGGADSSCAFDHDGLASVAAL